MIQFIQITSWLILFNLKFCTDKNGFCVLTQKNNDF